MKALLHQNSKKNDNKNRIRPEIAILLAFERTGHIILVRLFFVNNFRIVFLVVFLLACAEKNPEQLGSDSIIIDDINLDLREANVIAVSYSLDTSRLAVTLLHDDDNESGYANWWQVESLSGELLGRRELTHRHNSQPFTRDLSIEIDESII